MTKNMTQGSPLRLIIGFVLPLVLGNLLQQMYSMVDTVLVGRILGTDSLAAVGVSGGVNFLVLGFCCGICEGCAVPIAQRFGADDIKGVRTFIANSIWLCLAMSVLITAVTVYYCDDIMRFIKTPEDIFDEACGYIRIIFAGIPFLFLYNMLAGILRSLGDSRSPVIFLGISAVLNIILDIVFIVLLDTNASGAAAATIASQGCSGVICLIYIKKKFPMLKFESGELRPDRRYIMKLCSYGMPMGLQYSVTAIGSVILQTSVNALGTVYVAAVSAATRVTNIFLSFYCSIGSTMATYTGQNVGAWKLNRLKEGIKAAFKIGIVYSVVVFVIILLFKSTIAAMFVDSGNTEVAALMKRFLVINSMFYTLHLLINIFRSMIQSMGFGMVAIISGILEMLARGMLGKFIVPAFGFNAVCLADASAWLVADLFLIPCFIFCFRRIEGNNKGMDSHNKSEPCMPYI